MSVVRRGALRAALMVAAATGLFNTAAHAQAYDTSVGWGGGYMKYAPFMESGSATSSDIGFGASWLAVLQAEAWRFNRRVGARLGGFYSHGTVSMPVDDKRAASFGVEAAGLLRITAPSEESTVGAYLIGGGGLVWFAMDDRGQDIVPIPGTAVIYDADETRQFAALGGAGVEILPGWTLGGNTLGLRVEAIDQVTFGSPFRPADSRPSQTLHNLRFSVTLFAGVESIF